jgi:hypothetical protein
VLFSFLGKVCLRSGLGRDLRPLLARERLGVVLLVRKARCTFRVRERFVVTFWVRERLVCSPGYGEVCLLSGLGIVGFVFRVRERLGLLSGLGRDFRCYPG